MKVFEYLSKNDLPTYQRLARKYDFQVSKQNKSKRKSMKKKSEVELGDSIENLMKHRSYKRRKGAIRQTRW
ncbi:MAG: hypothetical protein FH761_17805 [Firmicutes bacterium]|nr:hypothetical protein [Bacillota bacterium]